MAGNTRTGSDGGDTPRSGWRRAGSSALALLGGAYAVGAVAVVAWQASASWSDASDAAQYFQSLATVAALLAGGGWALYVFEVGRAHAAFVQVRLETTSHGKRPEGRYAIVTASVRNTGRVALWQGYVRVDVFFFPAVPLGNRLGRTSVLGASDVSGLTMAVQENSEWSLRPYPSDGRVLPTWGEALGRFEPGQEVRDALVISLGDHPAASLRVRYVGHARRILLPQVRTPCEGKEVFFTRKTFEAWTMVDPEAKPEAAPP